MNYYHATKLHNAGFKEIIKKVTEVLKQEGFSVLTEIDIQDKLKEKLNVDFRKYTILGACNPPYAYRALQQEDKIGTMLPCNIIVQELNKNEVEVAAIDPVASMVAVKNLALADVANEINEKLKRVISSL